MAPLVKFLKLNRRKSFLSPDVPGLNLPVRWGDELQGSSAVGQKGHEWLGVEIDPLIEHQLALMTIPDPHNLPLLLPVAIYWSVGDKLLVAVEIITVKGVVVVLFEFVDGKEFLVVLG